MSTMRVTLPLRWNSPARRDTSPLIALATLAYLALAVALAGSMSIASPPDLRAPWLVPAVTLTLIAFGLERTSRRAVDVLAKNAAPALYIAAALLLPAPWAVLIAAAAAVACYATAAGLSAASRLAATAHTVVVVALFTVLAHLVSGDASLLRGLLVLAGLPGHVPPMAARAPFAGSGDATALDAVALAGLALGFYALDTLPLAAMAAVGGRMGVRRAWWALYARGLALELALPSLAILAALSYSVARPTAALAVPALLGLGVALERAAIGPTYEQKAGETRSRLGGRSAHRVAVAENGAQPQPAVEDVLAAVRAIAGAGDLEAVVQALARQAVLLTTSPSCTVYLYRADQGVFVPCASSDGEVQPERDKPIPRAAAEVMMAHHNRLGASYYSRVGQRLGNTPERWRAPDLLLTPLQLKNGDVTGYVSLHPPADGRLPQAADLAAVEAVAFLAAGIIARLRHADEALHLAATDPLTGLLNRRALEERLHRELSIDPGRPVALLMIDLDDFGFINNTYGHQIGDEALRVVSGVIHAHLRQDDAGGRYGGDEFTVILPGADALCALEIAERLRDQLVEVTTRVAAEGRLPRLAMSIGVAASPDDAVGAEALIKAADSALYSSKRRGKNRVSRCDL